MKVVVYGGCGALGRSIVERFKSLDHIVTSIDFKPNQDAHQNIVLTAQDFAGTSETILSQLKQILNGGQVDAIFTVAGGSLSNEVGPVATLLTRISSRMSI
jgi:dihydropteridine reductase